MQITRNKRILSLFGVAGAVCVVGSWYVLVSFSQRGVLAIVLLLAAGLCWTVPVGVTLWHEREKLWQTDMPRWLILAGVVLLLLAMLLMFPLVALNMLLVLTG